MSRRASPRSEHAPLADVTSPAPPAMSSEAPMSRLAGEQIDTASSSDSSHGADGVQADAAFMSAGPSAPTAAPSPPVQPAAAGGTVPGRAGKATEAAADHGRCPKCKSGGRDSRNLVVCIDGTSNQFSIKNTNVVELYSRLIKDKDQLTFYNSGIGTYAEPSFKSLDYLKQLIANKLDLMFALRFEKIIISAYRWLVDHYQEGDRIFLFGFSRGAYQVRVLAAMLDTVGLLQKGNEDQIPFAYELFAAGNKHEDELAGAGAIHPILSKFKPLKTLASHMHLSLRNSASRSFSFIVPHTARAKVRTLLGLEPLFPRPEKKLHPDLMADDGESYALQEHFKKTFSREVNAHFVGAWDTVSSVGFVRGKTLPGTTDGMQNVCFFRHALAMHEYRVKFLPEYANGGDGPDVTSSSGDLPHTKEVWFIGSHSDIGGGSTRNTTIDKFGPSLRWMAFEADTAGVRFKEPPIRQDWEPTLITDSMTWFYRAMEFLPIKRLSYKSQKAVSRYPHFCSQRRIRANQLIHQTVLNECGYGSFAGLQRDLKLDSSVRQEDDAYTNARSLLNIPCDKESEGDWLVRLRTLQETEPGRKSLFGLQREIWLQFACLRELSCPGEKKLQHLEDALIYGSACGATIYLSELLGTLRTSNKDTYLTYPFALRGHAGPISSVAFRSPKLVMSGSFDGTLLIWNIETGEAVGDPLRGHTKAVDCVAVSPDGSLVASGSDDDTIRTWKFEAGRFVGDGFVMQADGMRGVDSLAFSPDGLRIVSGSRDGALRMWDAATGQLVGETTEGHTNWVRSVAFSPDGARVVSGSEDLTVRLWDAKTFQALGDPLTGHTDRALSFSPDGVYVASASIDNTICIWNSETRQLVHTLEGHSDCVRSVAFSPSGRHIASGSDDNTVRIWDAVTGEAVGVLKGHTGSVYSVAFSPHGTRIASGSHDKTVRIWDRIPVSDLDTT